MASPVESPNTLISNTRVKIIDAICEGVNGGFWPVSGVSGVNPLCSVIFDDIPVMNGDGSPNWNISGQGFAFQYTSGASGQAPMVGFEKVEALVPLPFNTRVFNPPPNNGAAKSVIVSFNTTQYPDAEGVKITTRVPALYTVDTSNGNTNAFALFYEIDIAFNGGPWVSQILGPDGDGNPSTVQQIVGKCTSPYYKTHIIPLPKETPAAAYYSWKVRVRRIDQNILSSNTANDLYVDSIAIVSSNTYSYPMTAVVGLELSADQFAGTVPSRAYEIKGIKVQGPEGYTPTQYNVQTGTITAAVYPGVWLGTFASARVWTDNPAWIFYDLVTNRRYGLGNYIRPEWLDKWTLYQIAQYCDEMVDDGDGGLEPRFTCNVAITSPQDAYTLLNNLVSVFRGMLYWANGRIFPVGPETRDPVFNFTNANVVGGGFNYSDTPRNTRTTVCVVKWTDPSNLYRPTPERIEDLDGIGKYGYIEKQITAFATTSRGQAIRAAKWLLTVEQLLTETVSFQTDLEGLYLRPGDVFNVYDNYRNNQQQGGRIVDFNAANTYLTLDKTVTLEPGFTYVMSALVPATNMATGQGLTGSNQVGLIRNSQIETRVVATPAGSYTSVTVSGAGFSSNLYRGSVFILNGSGTSVTLFDQATQYKCLVTTEPQNGVVEILGVKYNTGVNYLVNNNYSVVVSPPIDGDTTPPAPPTGLAVARVTGLLNDNTFFQYLYISWSGSPSTNVAYYTVSGLELAFPPAFPIGQTTNTGINYVHTPGIVYRFYAGAVNANGYESAFVQTNYTAPGNNPLGTTTPLSGIIISTNYDPYYFSTALNRATGYVGTQPVFLWDVALDSIDDTLETPTAQFITGYRARVISVTGGEWNLLANPIILSGKNNTSLAWNSSFLITGASIKSLRAFTLAVDTLDEYGNTVSGGRLAVNNPHPRAPVASGFVGFNGGVSYNITPSRAADISGVYIWTNALPSFTPTFDNATLYSSNLAGFADAPQAGNVYTWFSIVDTYGPSGSILANGDYNAPIYGPISGNANQIAGELFIDVTADISGAFSLITGMVTNSINIVSGDTLLSLQTVQGLSGQITGLGGIPGAVNTALNVRVNTAIVSSSGSLSQQIDAVSARIETTGSSLTATVGEVKTALATTGGALSQYTQSLQAYASGLNSQVTIAAQAFVTGQVNGFGGVAVSRWGFKLDSNGKVVSMEAVSASAPGQTGNSLGVIAFAGASLQSNTFTAGSAGWRVQPNGDAEFNNISARGAFTGGAGSYLAVIDGQTFSIGAPAGNRISTAVVPGVSDARTFAISNTSNTAVAIMQMVSNAGEFYLANSAGTANITMIGSAGSINCDTLDVDSTSNFDGDMTFPGTQKIKFTNGGNTAVYINESNGLRLWGDGTHPVQISGSNTMLQYGVYTNTPLTIAGYIEILDANGTTRKLAVVA